MASRRLNSAPRGLDGQVAKKPYILCALAGLLGGAAKVSAISALWGLTVWTANRRQSALPSILATRHALLLPVASLALQTPRMSRQRRMGGRTLAP